ncbi:MAG: PilN domain-containing protein [Prochlorococcus sp.]|jgi:type IV pilus assembly protein PilN|nr:pilus assembly protein PilP [Prochlorococcaceae cyanobacterium ETNP18_MAG_14]MDP6309773.1 pilus assembly protein PilP [Prochlorococcaceae cyanobacterium ETNP14_MAG_4]HJM80392.1 pilus assembly protein PilP [Prochlorococcaceae cyanobacterium Fu_MAG_72]
MASSPNGPGLDLLQERRLEAGLTAQPAPVPPLRILLYKGIGLGALLVVVALVVAAWFAWQEKRQQVELDRLQPLEQRLKRDLAQLKQMKARTAVMRQDNTQIAEQLVAARASSALMEQLRLETPASIQLTEVSVEDERINIKGEARDLGFMGAGEAIDALKLNFSVLSMVKPGGVKVVKVERQGDGQEVQFVQFSIDVALDAKSRPSLQELRELGATGLVERYQLLERYGVAP